MCIRNIKITIDGGKRIVLYPEGGFHLECLVPGIGWVLESGPLDDDPCPDDDAWTHGVIMDARAALELAASRL